MQCEETLRKDWTTRCKRDAVLKHIRVKPDGTHSCVYFCLQHAKMNGYDETKTEKWQQGEFGKTIWRKSDE